MQTDNRVTWLKLCRMTDCFEFGSYICKAWRQLPFNYVMVADRTANRPSNFECINWLVTHAKY